MTEDNFLGQWELCGVGDKSHQHSLSGWLAGPSAPALGLSPTQWHITQQSRKAPLLMVWVVSLLQTLFARRGEIRAVLHPRSPTAENLDLESMTPDPSRDLLTQSHSEKNNKKVRH